MSSGETARLYDNMTSFLSIVHMKNSIIPSKRVDSETENKFTQLQKRQEREGKINEERKMHPYPDLGREKRFS